MGDIPLFSLAFPLAPSPCPSRSTVLFCVCSVSPASTSCFLRVYVYVYVHVLKYGRGGSAGAQAHRSAPLTHSRCRAAMLTYYQQAARRLHHINLACKEFIKDLFSAAWCRTHAISAGRQKTSSL